MEVLQAFVFALVAVTTSYIEERFGNFQNLPAGVKQIVNGVLSLVVPVAVSLVAGWWKPEFGDAGIVFTQIVYVLVPVLFFWVTTQVAHQADRILQYAGTWFKK